MKKVLKNIAICLCTLIMAITFTGCSGKIKKYQNLYKDAGYQVTHIRKEDNVKRVTATKGTTIVRIFYGSKNNLNTLEEHVLDGFVDENNSYFDYVRKRTILIVIEASTAIEITEAIKVIA